MDVYGCVRFGGLRALGEKWVVSHLCKRFVFTVCVVIVAFFRCGFCGGVCFSMGGDYFYPLHIKALSSVCTSIRWLTIRARHPWKRPIERVCLLTLWHIRATKRNDENADWGALLRRSPKCDDHHHLALFTMSHHISSLPPTPLSPKQSTHKWIYIYSMRTTQTLDALISTPLTERGLGEHFENGMAIGLCLVLRKKSWRRLS